MSLKKAVSFFERIACAAIIMFAMASCSEPTHSSGLKTVTLSTIVGPSQPNSGLAPVTSFDDNNREYKGTVDWSPAVNGTFAPSTVYTATITLTPKTGYTMEGVPANFFTLPYLVKVERISNAANSGVVTAVFPPTGTLSITIRAIEGLAIPVIGETPVTEIETAQYTGTVTWLPAVNGTFAVHTYYTATITITPKTGYYIPTGRYAVPFTVEGADMVSNDADSGVVIARFPQTGGTVNIPAIRGLTVPVTGEIPVTVIYNGQHTGTVAWSPAVNGTFAASTIYTATVTITPRAGYTLDGVAADFFTVAGAATVSNDANSGVITVTFPHTIGTINIAAIRGLTVPVTGEIPVTDIGDENEQYSGTITWWPRVPENGTFAASTTYTASVDLSAKTGYTLTGVPANFFTVAGADTVTNSANPFYVAVKFPQTGSLLGGFEYYWVDQHDSLVTSSNGSAIVLAGQTLTITAQGSGYVVKQWYLNGINTGQNGNTFKFSDTTAGKKHTISLFVEKDGKLYNTNIIITIGTYTVTYNINGGTGTAPPTQTAIYKGDSVSLAGGNGFSKSGYDFVGWGTYASGTVVNYKAGDSYAPTANVTLYAKWIITPGREENPIPLSKDVWTDGFITSTTSEGAVYYSFNVISGTRYYIWWNDSYQGTGSKSLNVKVSAYYASNYRWIFYNKDSGWTSPETFSAISSGKVIIEVSPLDAGRVGSFSILYRTTSTR